MNDDDVGVGALSDEDLRRQFHEAYPVCLRWFRRRVEDDATAEDLAQQTWMRYMSWLLKHPTERVHNVVGFLVRHAEWVRRDHYERLYRGEIVAHEADVVHVVADALAAQDRDLVLISLPVASGAVDRQVDVRRALADLSERERQAVLLRYGDEMTTTQIGAVLGISQQMASKLIRTVLTKLRGSPHLVAYGTGGEVGR